MSDVFAYLWLIPTLPLLAAAVIGLFGRYLKDLSHWPCVIAIGIAAFLSFNVLLAVNSESPPELSHDYYDFISVNADDTQRAHVHAPFSLRADALTAIMLTTVTGVGFLIAIFAIGYMAGDPGYPRFFAAVSLFMASMTLLVSGNNLVLLFMGWEGVGLCSYLLIGFWFSKPSAALAARKAFLVNRIGDFGFIIGIMMAWVASGYYLDYDHIFVELPSRHPEAVTAVCLLLFCGACGKSAQVPLHVWLPDAMEGPTPVSALIHAATMVTAGVYLVARCTPLFMLSPQAQLVVACIGGFTALFAALIALTQHDLKRVLAYSTLSQLGYMFLALGCAVRGHHDMVTFAVVAAIFHLFTHAFFKALLFLSAGSVMHAMGGIDMRRFGGLRTVMPKTHACFLVGALALAGIVPFAGFWSKDDILASALNATSAKYGAVYFILFVTAVLTAALTAFYTFRAYFRTFCGPLVVPPEAGSHGHGGHDAGHGHGREPKQGVAHESPPVMTVPLMILAVCAIVIGPAVGPTHIFGGWLERMHTERPNLAGWPKLHEHELNWPLMIGTTVLALGGIGLAYLMYVKKPETPGKLAHGMPLAYQASYNKFFVDELYDKAVVKRVEGVAEFCRVVDAQVVDGLVDTVGELPRLGGSLFRPVQNGLVQFYALAMMLGLTVFLIALARSF